MLKVVTEDSSADATPILELRGISKIYRMGEIEVQRAAQRRLRRPRRRDGGHHGRLGLGQVDHAQPHRHARPPDGGRVPARRRAGAGPRRVRARRAAQPQDRLRVPVVQPACRATTRSRTSSCRWSTPASGASARRKKAVRALERVGLGDRMDHLPNQLSGGQQQRVSIARAIVNEPLLLLADEPTGALDSTTTKQVMELFVELHRQGMTVVLVTHDPNIAAYAERVVSFSDGVIVSDETRAKDGNASDRITHATRLTASVAVGGRRRESCRCRRRCRWRCTSSRWSPRRTAGRSRAPRRAARAARSLQLQDRRLGAGAVEQDATSADRRSTTAWRSAPAIQTDPTTLRDERRRRRRRRRCRQPSQWTGLSNFQASLNYFLFSGFRVEANVKRAKLTEQAAIVQVKQQRKDTALAVARAYWSVRRAAHPARRAAVGAAAHDRRRGDRRRARARRAGAADRQEPRDAAQADADGDARGSRRARRATAAAQLGVVLGIQRRARARRRGAACPTSRRRRRPSWCATRSGAGPRCRTRSCRSASSTRQVLMARSGFFPQLTLFGLFQYGNNAFNVGTGARSLSSAANPFGDLSGNFTGGAQLTMNFFDTLNTLHRDRRRALPRAGRPAGGAPLRAPRRHRRARRPTPRCCKLYARRAPLVAARDVARDNLTIIEGRYKNGDALIIEYLDAQIDLANAELQSGRRDRAAAAAVARAAGCARLHRRSGPWLTEIESGVAGWRPSLIVVLLGGGGVLAVASAAAPDPKEIDPSLITTVKRGDLAIEVIETGKVQPREKVEIKSKVAGQVAQGLRRRRRSREEGAAALAARSDRLRAARRACEADVARGARTRSSSPQLSLDTPRERAGGARRGADRRRHRGDRRAAKKVAVQTPTVAYNAAQRSAALHAHHRRRSTARSSSAASSRARW